MESTTTPASSGPETISVRLNSLDASYILPVSTFVIPRSWRRGHLSELLNKVLETATPQPFEFFIESNPLRQTLDAYTKQHDVPNDITLSIDFLPSILPPSKEPEIQTPGWVSDIAVASSSQSYYVLSTSYNGVWALNIGAKAQYGSEPLSQQRHGHTEAATACCWMRPPIEDNTAAHIQFATGSLDQTVKVWTSNLTPDHKIKESNVIRELDFEGQPVVSVHSRSSFTQQLPSQLLVGYQDGRIALWDTSIKSSGTESGSKGKKLKNDSSSSKRVLNKADTLGVLTGHRGASKAIFDNTDTRAAHSISYDDHSVRTWDLTMYAEASKKENSSRTLTSLAQLASPNLLVTGTMERAVCLWDIRDTTVNISADAQGHRRPITSVAAHPVDPTRVASSSLDNTVRVWDVRYPKSSLFVLPVLGNDSDRALYSLAWDGSVLVSGDNKGTIHRWSMKDDDIRKNSE